MQIRLLVPQNDDWKLLRSYLSCHWRRQQNGRRTWTPSLLPVIFQECIDSFATAYLVLLVGGWMNCIHHILEGGIELNDRSALTLPQKEGLEPTGVGLLLRFFLRRHCLLRYFSTFHNSQPIFTVMCNVHWLHTGNKYELNPPYFRRRGWSDRSALITTQSPWERSQHF